MGRRNIIDRHRPWYRRSVNIPTDPKDTSGVIYMNEFCSNIEHVIEKSDSVHSMLIDISNKYRPAIGLQIQAPEKVIFYHSTIRKLLLLSITKHPLMYVSPNGS